MLNWRVIFSTKEDQKPGVYKSPAGKRIPNNAEFTGNKFPSSGNPVKHEQSAWAEGNKLQQSDSKKEIAVKQNSPIMDEKTRREKFESLKTKSASRFFVQSSEPSNWRSFFLTKKADTSFKQKPDGTLQIDVTTPRPGQPQLDGQAPNQEIVPQAPATPATETEQPEEKKSSEKRAFYEDNQDFMKWFSEKSQDPNFIELYHTYVERAHLDNTEEPEIFEEWAYKRYMDEVAQVPVSASEKVSSWTIDEKGDYRLEGRECKTHCGVAIMKGNEELEFQKIARQGHEWRELISQGVWQNKLEQYASQK